MIPARCVLILAAALAATAGNPIDAEACSCAVAEEHATASPPRPYAHPSAKTDAAGAFELLGVPPARYVIGINLTGPRYGERPYPRTYFPGTTLPAEAAIIEVAAGERRDGLRIVLAERK